MKTTVLSLLTVCMLFVGCTNNATQEATPVIFDTDIGNDIDDVLALQMLINYHKAGKINLLGVTSSKSNPHSIEFLDAYLRYNGLCDMPLGYAYNGVKCDDGKYLCQTLDAEHDDEKILKVERNIDNTSIPAGDHLMRKLLAEARDQSVVIIAVGPMTNMGRLMEGEADEFSSLNGVELVSKKVKLIEVMAGEFANTLDRAEWNIDNDLPASKILFEKCPVPLIASGWEVGRLLRYPAQSIDCDFERSHPLSVAYYAWGEMPYDRPTWDLTSVLHAIEPNSDYFETSPCGVIKLDEEGRTTLEPSPAGLHKYLIIPQEKIQHTLDAIVNTTTNK